MALPTQLHTLARWAESAKIAAVEMAAAMSNDVMAMC